MARHSGQGYHTPESDDCATFAVNPDGLCITNELREIRLVRHARGPAIKVLASWEAGVLYLAIAEGIAVFAQDIAVKLL